MSAQPVHEHGPTPRDPKAILAALRAEDAGIGGNLAAKFTEEYEHGLDLAHAPTYDIAAVNTVLDRWYAYVNLPVHSAAEDTIEAVEAAGGAAPGFKVTLDYLRKTA